MNVNQHQYYIHYTVGNSHFVLGPYFEYDVLSHLRDVDSYEHVCNAYISTRFSRTQ